jgi:parallel beta-helix repeat protein
MGDKNMRKNSRVIGEFINRDRMVSAVWVLVLLLCVTRVSSAQTAIFVDDDGKQCPGSVRTIQEAVASASAGSTIVVCPGTYQGTVNLIGHDKDRLKIVAAGSQDEVILQGDHMQEDGFHLEDVTGVLLQGFTVRDFGMIATTKTVQGMGNNIRLLRANQSSILHNRATRSDMMGIYLSDSGDNTIEDNVTFENDANGVGCGIMLDGRLSSNNVIRRNLTYGQALSGIMVVNAGSGNILIDNDASDNGQWGIDNRGTNGTIIQGNRASNSKGRYTGPGSPFLSGAGIDVRTSSGVTVKDNIVHDNLGFDIYWDNTGTNVFQGNGLPGYVVRTLAITNTTDGSRNPGFRSGDAFRVSLNNAPANAPVFLRVFKDGIDLGVSGPYGINTDAQGQWTYSGTFDLSNTGSWLVQAMIGGRQATDASGVVSMTISRPPAQ